ncbi:serine/threonine-protein phosphatase 6 regulatory ankyrin repeat subunit C-like [Daphnia carinata]|uniref:serine/threonine-protein phosphatase 6 regulatory ankyrin repeat subunit C-like n=1 Tax=Daphnia carinata TaxID=120202 RepID=UPI00257D7562|nr:serine/threonine-protein phosphatase 6 regulatory ankyrin repeat subunit C-like [Daphnia carinata]
MIEQIKKDGDIADSDATTVELPDMHRNRDEKQSNCNHSKGELPQENTSEGEESISSEYDDGHYTTSMEDSSSDNDDVYHTTGSFESTSNAGPYEYDDEESVFHSDDDRSKMGHRGDYYDTPASNEEGGLNHAQKEHITRSCRNCMLKTFPPLVAGDAANQRIERLATIAAERGQFVFEIINAPRETLRKFLKGKEEEGSATGRSVGSLLDTKFPNGRTMLHESVNKKRYDVTELLLTFGANIDITEKSETIAHRAAADNNEHILGTLSFHRCQFSEWNCLGETPLMVAIALKNEESIGFLWITPLIKQLSRDGETILHYAARFNSKKEYVNSACMHGVNVNQKSLTRRETALIAAVRYGNPEIVEVLLRNGARYDEPDYLGNYATDYIGEREEIAKVFLNRNIKPRRKGQKTLIIHYDRERSCKRRRGAGSPSEED